MARKTRAEAFEHQLDAAQLSQLRQWCLAEGYGPASQKLLEQWGVKASVKMLFRWYHKDDSVALLKTLTSSAHLAGQIEDAVAKNPRDPLVACEKAISAIALKTLAGQATREEMELALELFRTAMESRSSRTKAAQKEEELRFAVEKFKESLRTKTDVALDAFAEFLKGQPVLLEKFNALRAEVKAVMS